jgi:hypothetical protein
MKLQFGTNQPIEVCLMTLDGETVESQYGGPQRKYTTTDRDTFYVSDAVGNIIAETCRKLKIEEREPVVICKAEVHDGRGRKAIRWQVTRVNAPPPEVGPQPDGGFAVPHTNGANGSHPPAPPVAPTTQVQQPMPSPINNGNGTANGGGGHVPPPASLLHSGWALALREQSQVLIDVYASALNYAQRYAALDIAAEDIKSIVLSAYISGSKNGNGGTR